MASKITQNFVMTDQTTFLDLLREYIRIETNAWTDFEVAYREDNGIYTIKKHRRVERVDQLWVFVLTPADQKEVLITVKNWFDDMFVSDTGWTSTDEMISEVMFDCLYEHKQ